MKPPIFVRELSENEREELEAGLRSKDAFVMRRCQVLLASARGLSPPKIAENLGCASQTVRNAIRTFNPTYFFIWDAHSKVMASFELIETQRNDPYDNVFTLRYQ